MSNNKRNALRPALSRNLLEMKFMKKSKTKAEIEKIEIEKQRIFQGAVKDIKLETCGLDGKAITSSAVVSENKTFEGEANQQLARAKLRERFLRLSSALEGRPATFEMVGNIIVVEAVFGGIGINFQDVYVKKLKSPMGVINTALLRSTDKLMLEKASEREQKRIDDIEVKGTISAEEMAKRYSSLVGTINKKFQKRKRRSNTDLEEIAPKQVFLKPS